MPEERGSGRLEDSPLAQPEGARPRATWETTTRSRTIRDEGQPEDRIEGDTEGPGFRATWRSVNRHRRRMRDSRRLGAPSPAKPEMQDEGKPEAYIAGVAEEVRMSGRPGGITETSGAEGWENSRQLENPSPARPKDRGSGATRGSGHPAQPRARSTGQPGDAQLAKPEDAGAGETRNQHERLNGTMHDPMSYQDTRRAPEAARSLAFSSHRPEPFLTRT
jgi:hypothetical protein